VGKLSNLEAVLAKHPMEGFLGVGHTRWATHGVPSEENAHPHRDCSGKIVVVHNGIIENYVKLKTLLIRKGHRFASQTDTEVIAHLIEENWKSSLKRRGAKLHTVEQKKKEFEAAVRQSLKMLEGSYALGIINAEFSDLLIAARKDSPLVLGLGEGENFIASDVPALISSTRRTIFMEQEEMAVLSKDSIECFSLDGKKLKKDVVTVKWDPLQAEKSGYKHFMLKEIMEQPKAIEDTMRGRIFCGKDGLHLEAELSPSFVKHLDRIVLIACGTSYHAALVGRFWLEYIAKVPCQVEIASEFRYRASFLGKKDLAIFISQSGETADTLAALRMAKKNGARTLAICNVLGSSITREAHTTLYTHCGPEIGVASTKAFTGQLTALILLAVKLGGMRGILKKREVAGFLRQIVKLPGWIRESLVLSGHIKNIGEKFCKKHHFLYLGRNLNYPVALEGALKLKEISYIHAEGYPAGEMKHGPIALIDKEMPVVAIVTDSPVYEKIRSNIEEAKARGGIVIAVASRGDHSLKGKADEIIYVPKVPDVFSPIVNSVPLQLLAYHIAVLRGSDVDQPRNLAKSVTVE
jgi:glucosamine--fructose-6-phosphate aminotransferase (isomerizing)